MLKFVPMILFNLIELICVVIFGLLLKTELVTIILIFGVWLMTRMILKEPMHYKSPVKCFIMTILLFISIFLATKVDLSLGILCVVFDAFIMSKHANIKQINENMFQWNNLGDNRKSIYQDLIKIIENEPMNKIIIDYENYWRDNYQQRYQIFNLFFKQRLTYEKIIKILNLNDNTTIKNECRIIYATLELPLKLKKIK